MVTYEGPAEPKPQIKRLAVDLGGRQLVLPLLGLDQVVLDCFTHAGGKQARSPQLKRNLIACLIGLSRTGSVRSPALFRSRW